MHSTYETKSRHTTRLTARHPHSLTYNKAIDQIQADRKKTRRQTQKKIKAKKDARNDPTNSPTKPSTNKPKTQLNPISKHSTESIWPSQSDRPRDTSQAQPQTKGPTISFSGGLPEQQRETPPPKPGNGMEIPLFPRAHCSIAALAPPLWNAGLTKRSRTRRQDKETKGHMEALNHMAVQTARHPSAPSARPRLSLPLEIHACASSARLECGVWQRQTTMTAIH